MRMILEPVPRRGHDIVDLGVARLPAQLVADLLGVGIKSGRVAGAARAIFHRHFFAGHRARPNRSLPDRIAAADAQVVEPRVARPQGVHRHNVGLAKVFDMNIIADARAVGRRIVGAEDDHLFPLAQERLQE